MNAQIGIEFIFPNEAWRLCEDGIGVLGDLFHQLSPYRDRPLTKEDFLKLADESACLLVAVDLAHKGHMVGIARLIVRLENGLRYGVIHDVVVDVSYRRAGIGKALTRKLLSLARRFHLDVVELPSKPERVFANLMYLSLGFALVSAADPSDPMSTNHYQLTLSQ